MLDYCSKSLYGFKLISKFICTQLQLFKVGGLVGFHLEFALKLGVSGRRMDGCMTKENNSSQNRKLTKIESH